MFHPERDEDTICALSSGAGRAGISVIRVSGKNALEYVRKNCSFLAPQPESHRAYLGEFKSSGDDSIDQVLVTYFSFGHSYTGEETIEISCHGSPSIVSETLEQLIQSGCRAADPGEFTFRAFMNDRIDLVQAEGVLSLIESQSRSSRRHALRQLRGEASKQFQKIEEDLLWLLSRLEINIDFSLEGLQSEVPETISAKLEGVIDTTKHLLSSYESGRLLREGARVVICGRPNSGKSSLLNAILQEERAIVDATPGTTRDTVEGRKSFGFASTVLVDTAGIRETEDPVEKTGVKKTFDSLAGADLILLAIDLSQGMTVEDEDLKMKLDPKKTLIVGTKKDKATLFSDVDIATSSKTGEGISELEKKILNFLKAHEPIDTAEVIQARHYGLLKKVSPMLARTRALFETKSGEEFMAFELRESLNLIYEILGKNFNEQVIHQVFKDFCIGK